MIVQWVDIERPTEKPGAILTRVRVPGGATDFSARVNIQLTLRCLYSRCAIAFIKKTCTVVPSPGKMTRISRQGQ